MKPVFFEFLRRYPRLGLAAADLAGATRYRLGRAVAGEDFSTREDWERLLGPLPASRVRRIQRLQAGRMRRLHVLERLLKKEGFCGLTSLYEWKNADFILDPLSRGQPVIVGSWHVGPLFGFPLGLAAFDAPLTMILHQKVSGAFPDRWELVFTGQGRAASVEAFKRGTARLKAGGLVAMALDNFDLDSDCLPVSCFGLDLRLRRGFAALARSARARVVPLALQWLPDGRLRFEAQAPLATTLEPAGDREEFERAVLHEFAQRLDTYMREHPEDMDPRRVGRFVNAWKRQHGLPHDPAAPGRG